MFKALEIKPGIWWVGVLEWNERSIHGFSMPYGSTNNAYLIMDEHITLIDTCSESYWPELLERIASVVDPSRIEYLVSNHAEKDHEGALRQVLAKAPQAKVIASPQGCKILKTYLGDAHELIPMKTGDSLSIGQRTLQFIQTPMVHWPDNMVTYAPEDKILFSNDAFGQFLATSERFDDEVDRSLLFPCAKKYFANIIMPFAKQTAKAVAAVKGLSLDMIAPSHGLIWRSQIPAILEAYETWCQLKPTSSAVVAYASMYGSTGRMARAIAEAFASQGISVRLYDLKVSDISDIMDQVMDAQYVAVGSSCQNMTVLPEAGRFLTYLKGLAPKGRTGIAFGSYGWSEAGQQEISAVLKEAGFTVPLEPFTAEWNSTSEGEELIFSAICSLVSKQAEELEP